MPDWKAMEEQMKKMEPVRKAFGPVKRRAIPVFEDCVNYPIDQVVEMVKLANDIDSHAFSSETEDKIARFKKMLEAIHPLENTKERVYLWDDGKMPVETDYTDSNDYRYNHGPDYKPYVFEMLVPETVEPKGAIILCAGGDHGQNVVAEGYQNALDLNALGYQCFILLNRTNHNPWTAREAGVDAARAIRMVRANAEKYRVQPDHVVYAGFSNGGLTGEGLIEHFSGKQAVQDVFPKYQPDALDDIDATPDAFLCIYGPRFVNDPFDYEGVVYPPTFFAVGREDFGMENLNYVYPDLVKRGVPVEIHTFAGVPHGGAGFKITEGIQHPNFELWLPLADAFLQDVFTKKALSE